MTITGILFLPLAFIIMMISRVVVGGSLATLPAVSLFLLGLVFIAVGAIRWAGQGDSRKTSPPPASGLLRPTDNASQPLGPVTSPGWFPDQEDPLLLRYWDGQQWTDQYAQRHKPDEDQGQREPGDGA